jgi:hypothetical protein
MLPFVLANPWRGDTPLLDPRFVWDTSALTEPGRSTRTLFSLDFNYHGSGWFANSDFEQCLHLSISHKPEAGRDGETAKPVSPSDEEVRTWGRAAFGEHRHKALVEPPASTLSIDVLYERRSPGVAHIRLWLDRDGQPIKPEGEVYHLKPWDDGTSPEKVLEGRAGADVR